MQKLKELFKSNSVKEKIESIKNSGATPQNIGRQQGYWVEQIDNLYDIIFDDGETKFLSVDRLKNNTFNTKEITSLEEILKTGSDGGADLIKERGDKVKIKSSKIKKGNLSEDSSGITKAKAVTVNLGYDPNNVEFELVCRERSAVHIKTQDKIHITDLEDLEPKYQRLKEHCARRDYNISQLNRELKIKRRDFEDDAHFYQRLVLLILLGAVRHSEGTIILDTELFARFRKTALALKLADELNQAGTINDLQIDGGILTSISSFKKDINKTNFKSSINLVEDTREGDFLDNHLNIVMPSLHGDVERHRAVIDRPNERKLVLQDESDAVAPTSKKIKGRKELASDPKIRMMMSGTNTVRGSRGFVPSISIGVAYKDMLKFKHGGGPFVDGSPRDAVASVIKEFGAYGSIDHPAFEEAIRFVTDMQQSPEKMRWMKESVSIYPDKHYFQAKYDNTGHNEVIQDNSQYLNDINKCFTDVPLHENTLETVVRALLGTTQDPNMMWLQKELNIAQFNKVMRHPMDEGMIFWLPANTPNKQVYEFEERVQRWASNYKVGALIGSWENNKGTNSHEVEERAYKIYQDAKRAGQKGVILIMRKIGERSFSPNFITTGIAFYDGGNLYNCIQQDHRDDTPGKTFNGHIKQDSLFVSLSVNPDRVSPIDQITIAGCTGNINEYHSIPGINFWKKDRYGNAVRLEEGEQAQQLNNKGVRYLAHLLGEGLTLSDELIEQLAFGYQNIDNSSKKTKSGRNLKGGKSKEKEEKIINNQNEEAVVDKEAQAHQFLKKVFETMATVVAIANCDSDDMSYNLQAIQNDPDKLEQFVKIYVIEPKVIDEAIRGRYNKLFNTILSRIRADRKTQVRRIFETV